MVLRKATGISGQVAVGRQKWGSDSAQASGMVLSYFCFIKGTSYEHAPENHHAVFYQVHKPEVLVVRVLHEDMDGTRSLPGW